MAQQNKQIMELRMMLLGSSPEPALQSFSSCARVELDHKSKAELGHIVISNTKRLADSYISNKDKSATITKLRSEVATLKQNAQKQ